MDRIATVKGYTAQARWYAANMAEVPGTEEWKQAGWTKLANGIVKPVFTLVDGRNVVILDGTNHLTIVINQVTDEVIHRTELECYK